jgi:hypothetical protein
MIKRAIEVMFNSTNVLSNKGIGWNETEHRIGAVAATEPFRPWISHIFALVV